MPPIDRPLSPPTRGGAILERLTACLLIVVVLALAWMLVVSYEPEWLRMASVEAQPQEGQPAAAVPELEARQARGERAEVLIVLGLLTAALALVSVVSLLHTRRR